MNLEDYYIGHFRTLDRQYGYNLRTAERTMMCEEICRKISEAAKGRILSKEHKLAISNSLNNRTQEEKLETSKKLSLINNSRILTEEQKESHRVSSLDGVHNRTPQQEAERRRKIGEKLKGKSKSKEHIQKMKNSLTGRKLTEEHKRHISEGFKKKTPL